MENFVASFISSIASSVVALDQLRVQTVPDQFFQFRVGFVF